MVKGLTIIDDSSKKWMAPLLAVLCLIFFSAWIDMKIFSHKRLTNSQRVTLIQERINSENARRIAETVKLLSPASSKTSEPLLTADTERSNRNRS